MFNRLGILEIYPRLYVLQPMTLLWLLLLLQFSSRAHALTCLDCAPTWPLWTPRVEIEPVGDFGLAESVRGLG
jgi:hypothetical protein